jgi:hypothetical protein
MVTVLFYWLRWFLFFALNLSIVLGTWSFSLLFHLNLSCSSHCCSKLNSVNHWIILVLANVVTYSGDIVIYLDVESWLCNSEAIAIAFGAI